MKTESFCFNFSLPSPLLNQQIFAIRFDATTFSPADLLLLPHHQQLQKAVISRQAEHLAGRLMARDALIHLGVQATIPAIGSHRQPLWPENVMGSISHNRHIALATVAKMTGDRLEGIGIDIESLIASDHIAEVVDGIIGAAEYAVLTSSSLSFEIALTLVFSAKESLFKALFAHVGTWFDFSAAHIESISPLTQKFTLRLAEPLSPTLPAGLLFEGQWRWLDNNIVTFIRI